MNSVGPIKEATRQKVLQAAKLLDYHPNAIAQSFARRKSGNVGVVLPFVPKVHLFSTYYFSEILSGIGEVVQESGYDLLLLFRKPGEPLDYSQYYQTRKVDACIMLGTHNATGEKQALRSLQQENRAFCLVNQHFQEECFNEVDADHMEGSYTVVKHLIELGNRTIVFLNGPLMYSNSTDRLAGYARAMAEAGIDVEPWMILEGNYSRKSGYEAAAAIYSQRAEIDAVFAANDRMAIGLMQGLRELGCQPGRDIAVVGYDNSDASRFAEPPLTTVEVPFYEMGRLAAKKLLTRHNSAEPVLDGYFREILPTKLIIRASSTRIRRNEVDEFVLNSKNLRRECMKKMNIGMIGYKFMGKAHSHAYRDLPMFFPDSTKPVMRAICGRDEAGVKQAAEQFGWESYETDWRELVKRDEIDIIDINAPSNAHKEIAIAAAQAGKHLFCEKPLALTLPDAREMLKAAEHAGIKHMIGFNYRFAPAIMLAKKLIEEGRLGQIYHYRAWFLQDWIIDPDFPLVWRLDKEVAGSGSLGDLGAHLIDLAHYLIGGMTEVSGMSETFIKERPTAVSMTGLTAKGNSHAPKAPVTVDDATLFLSRFENGALGSFESTRFAAGHRCTNSFEINGSKGSVKFDFERMNELQVYFRDDADDVQGFRRVLATDGPHAYMNAWWPPGHTIGYEHTFIHEVVELMQAFAENRQPVPNFADGVKCHEVMEAVERSIAERRWVSINEV